MATELENLNLEELRRSRRPMAHALGVSEALRHRVIPELIQSLDPALDPAASLASLDSALGQRLHSAREEAHPVLTAASPRTGVGFANAQRQAIDAAYRRAEKLSRELAEACRHLDWAANGFMSADLRGAELTSVDLSWVQWNEETQWPEAWAQRVRRASVEQPPGSAMYVVLPEDHRASAEVLQ
ncbi:hypothetical protein ACFT8V_09035 [Streptomyces griseoincarnatus]